MDVELSFLLEKIGSLVVENELLRLRIAELETALAQDKDV
jgi:hypothetical protein